MLRLFFSFNGRVNRLTYWLGNLAVNIAGFFGMSFGMMLAGTQAYDKSAESMLRMASTMGLTIFPILLAMSWAGFALQVKRFHDRGRSGLFAMIPFIPMTMVVMTVMGGITTNAPVQQTMAHAGLYINLLMLIGLWFFIDLGCLPGKPESNKYGEPPRGGFGMGHGSPSAPAAPSVPGVAVPGVTPRAPAPAALGGAEAAMQRAIAEQAKAKVATPSTAMPARAPGGAPRPAMATAGGSGGFGRKPSR